jgi:hypothetical protein
VGAPDRLRTRFGKAEVLDLAFLDQVPHRACYLFDGHLRVDAVLVVEVDGFDPEPLERALSHPPDVFGTAVEHLLVVGAPELEAELGGDHHPAAEGLECFAHDLLVLRAVDLGGVEEGDAALGGRPDQVDRLLLVGRRAVAVAKAHRAITDGGDFETALSECALVHRFSFGRSLGSRYS